MKTTIKKQEEIEILKKELNRKNKICCNKPMIDLGVVDFFNGNTINCNRWVCGLCGTFIDEHEYSLDEDEFISEADNFEELKATEYYKSLEVDEE